MQERALVSKMINCYEKYSACQDDVESRQLWNLPLGQPAKTSKYELS